MNDNEMGCDRDKVDELTLALPYLVMRNRQEGCGARAWKGFEWDTMNRLHAKGWISDPRQKAKSIQVTEEATRKAEEASRKHFGREEE